jgi:hypothetical protein
VANWIGHILHTNFLLKHVTEHKRKDGKTRKKKEQLLDDLKGTRKYRILKGEQPDGNL